MPEVNIQALCKMSVVVRSNTFFHNYTCYLFSFYVSGNTITLQHTKRGIMSGSLAAIPEKGLTHFASLSQVQQCLKSSMTWNEFDLSKNYKTLHCIFITNHTEQLCISNIYMFAELLFSELQRFWFVVQEAFKFSY